MRPFCNTTNSLSDLSDRYQMRISNHLELFSIDAEFVDGPEETVFTGLGNAHELGFGGIDFDLGERSGAFAFGHGFAPFFAIFGNLNFVTAGVVAVGAAGIESDGGDF